jgi:hypothetical protein
MISGILSATLSPYKSDSDIYSNPPQKKIERNYIFEWDFSSLPFWGSHPGLSEVKATCGNGKCILFIDGFAIKTSS